MTHLLKGLRDDQLDVPPFLRQLPVAPGQQAAAKTNTTIKPPAVTSRERNPLKH
jgi:hypothetical protein